MEWVNKTCEDCKYQVESECRYAGPGVYARVSDRIHEDENAFCEACSKWREKQ